MTRISANVGAHPTAKLKKDGTVDNVPKFSFFQATEQPTIETCHLPKLRNPNKSVSGLLGNENRITSTEAFSKPNMPPIVSGKNSSLKEEPFISKPTHTTRDRTIIENTKNFIKATTLRAEMREILREINSLKDKIILEERKKQPSLTVINEFHNIINIKKSEIAMITEQLQYLQ